MDVNDFLAALFGDWVALMSGIGSVVLLVLSLTAFYNKPTPRWIVIAVAAICFFLASVRVWTTEHRKYLEEARKNTPQLVAEIQQLCVGGSTTDRDTGKPYIKDGTPVLVIATVENTGMPSVARGWKASVQTPEGKVVVGESHYVPPNIIVGDKGNQRRLSGDDALYDKAMTPIPQGGAITGVLLFVFKDITAEQIFKTNSIVTLEFEDILKKKLTATFKMSGKRDENLYFPGMKSPLIQPKQ